MLIEQEGIETNCIVNAMLDQKDPVLACSDLCSAGVDRFFAIFVRNQGNGVEKVIS